MGVVVISALYGRVSAEEDDQDCQDLAARFRERFLDRFGTLRCSELREAGYGTEHGESCPVLVERGSRVLVEVIEEARLRLGK